MKFTISAKMPVAEIIPIFSVINPTGKINIEEIIDAFLVVISYLEHKHVIDQNHSAETYHNIRTPEIRIFFR